jgi:hypothetical protein
MSKYMTKYHAADLLNALADKGLTDRNQALSDFIISQQQETELPLYLRALIGVGAFIASVCFIGFLVAAEIISFRNETGMIIWGLIFVAAAIGLQQIAGADNTVKHSFFMQSSFTSMAVGKTLFVFGATEILESGWGASIATLIITGATYHIYRMSIDRFLSSFAVIFSILVNILLDPDVSGARELLFNGFFLFQIAGAAILFTHGKIKCDYIPLSYAFAFSLCVSILFLASQAEFGYWQHKGLIHPAFVNVVLTGGLIALIGWAAGGMEKLKREALLLASSGAVLLGLISAPGIILAIGLMILGYAKHEKLLITLGGLLTPIFLFLYYYNLDISLMHKSGILLGSGVLLLAGRVYLKYKGWDKGGISCAPK